MRTIFTLMMIAGFSVIIYLGPVALLILVSMQASVLLMMWGLKVNVVVNILVLINEDVLHWPGYYFDR